MFSSDNFSQAHILRIREQTKADPAIIERTIYAFGLLEAISKVGIMTKNEYERIEAPDTYRAVKLPIHGVKKVNSLKNIDPEAYAYMVRAFQMLLDYGLYKNGVMGNAE